MTTELAIIAKRCDETVERARAELVAAVRAAAADGMTQVQIAAEIGRSQPEVSRLLRFHGTSALSMALRERGPAIRRLVTEAGGSHVRVFGSVATGDDGDGSDIDLLFTMGRPLSLMQLGDLEQRISDLLGGRSVDLVPDTALRVELRGRILAEAVSL